ncbi:MAG: hypothetical protein R3C58_05840 [Parvularculaceae bacterium]
MQNLQLTLLSLFGGKPAGDAVSGVNAFAADQNEETGGESFFSFIEGLLTAPKKEDDRVAEFLGSPFASQLPTVTVDAIRRALADAAPERFQVDGAQPAFAGAPRLGSGAG